jgi:threonine dehydratase
MSDAVTLERIREAARLIAGRVHATPSVPAARLSARFGLDLTLKLENLQLTGSFKARGALVRLLGLDDAARARGVIAMSAGNHAQGVAFHARALAIPATIVMPTATPFTKVDRTAALGAAVVLEGETLAESAAVAERLARERGLTFVHPYDDPDIVAGQGTVALELLAAAPALDALVVPIGGGGLIAGIATAARALRPGIRIVGVQSALYPAMARALAGDATPLPEGPTLAEGIAVKTPGTLTREIVRRLVDEILLVDEAAIERAVDLLLVEEKLLAEGAGAAGLAAVLADPARWRGARVGLVICGGNVDPRIAASILMRGLAAEGRLARLRVEVHDAPGALARVTGAIAAAGGNIVEVIHQRHFRDVPVTRADLDVMVETRGPAQLAAVKARLAEAGFPATELEQAARAAREPPGR